MPNATPEVRFHASAFGRMISTGSDVTDHVPLSSTVRKMREGYISVAVGVAVERGRLVGTSGEIEVYAHADGLESARLKIKL